MNSLLNALTFGSQAVSSRGSTALRPRLTAGLPLSRRALYAHWSYLSLIGSISGGLYAKARIGGRAQEPRLIWRYTGRVLRNAPGPDEPPLVRGIGTRIAACE